MNNKTEVQRWKRDAQDLLTRARRAYKTLEIYI